LALTGEAKAGSQRMLFASATVSQINNAKRGEHVIPAPSPNHYPIIKFVSLIPLLLHLFNNISTKFK